MIRRHPDRSRAVILRYHSVSDWTEESSIYREHAIAVAPALFDRQMAFLAAHYRVVALGELVQCLAENRPFPERAVAITFDDGYRDNFVHALPTLRRYGLPATVYVTTGGVGNGWQFWQARMRAVLTRSSVPHIQVPGLGVLDLSAPEERQRSMRRLSLLFKSLPLEDANAMLDAVGRECGVEEPVPGADTWMMSWDEMREMVRCGVEVGAHTCSHPILTRQTSAAARDEIERSRRVLQEGLGTVPAHFAYPNGSGVINHDERTARLVREAGFLSAATSVNGPLRRDADRFRLHRVGVSRHSAFDGFILNLERDRLVPRPAARSRSSPP
jgi:peptidoglycan/xylan/chitin deacetylase (PgdA/CDA1 family)